LNPRGSFPTPVFESDSHPTLNKDVVRIVLNSNICQPSKVRRPHFAGRSVRIPVQRFRARLLEKMEMKTTAELVRYAVKNRLAT
jgi:hypothetical protein